ncbi:hypothetical protein T484DRAFT_1757111 [Baffinella frigidus]|nr:hypothetical protein T484DRAFT_1757111 [Cryptophyta sp. CCMP2293]
MTKKTQPQDLSINPKIMKNTRIICCVTFVIALVGLWWFNDGTKHVAKIDAVLEDPRQAEKLSFAVHDTVGRAAQFYDVHMKGVTRPEDVIKPFKWCRDFPSLQPMPAHIHATICNQRVKKDPFTNAPRPAQDTHEFLTNMKTVDCSDADQFASRERTSITSVIINTGVTIKGPSAFHHAELAFDQDAQPFAATHFGTPMWKNVSSVDTHEEFKTHWIACNSLMTSVKNTEAFRLLYWFAWWSAISAWLIVLFYVAAEYAWWLSPKDVTRWCYFLKENAAKVFYLFYRFVMSVVRRAKKVGKWDAVIVAAFLVAFVVWWFTCKSFYLFIYVTIGWDLEFLNDWTCKALPSLKVTIA